MKIPYWNAYLTLATKEVRRFMRIWMQTLLPPVVTTALYFMIFGQLIGSRIGPMEGLAYIDYIVPGLILMAIINHAYSNVSSSLFSAKFQKQIEELLIAPIPNSVILAGFVTGGVLRGLCVGVVVTLVAMLFSDFHMQHPWFAILVALLTALLFSLAGAINAIYARSFDDISVIPSFVLTPMIYLGGIFYTISWLPSPWHEISLLNPILYMINAFRYGVLGLSDINPYLALGMIMLISAFMAWFSHRLLQSGHGIKP